MEDDLGGALRYRSKIVESGGAAVGSEISGMSLEALAELLVFVGLK